MRLLALRAILAGLLIATVIHKVWLSRTEPPDIRAAVVSLVLRNGWSAYEETGKSDQPLGNAINFQAADCEEFGRIFIVDLGLQAAPMLDHTISPSYARHFIYLGRTWPALDRVGMRIEWLKQKTLSLIGLGQYVVNESALVIAEPRDCRIADKVDWSALWARREQQAHLSSGKL